MTSNQGENPGGEVRLPMPEMEQADINIREKITRMKSDADEFLKRSGSSQTRRPKIQRVSSVLRNNKTDWAKYFEPKIVALGPLHHGNPRFKRSEQFKLLHAGLFINENDASGEVLFNNIKAEIDDLKNCYNPADISGFDDDKLAWMLFVDGCAVLYAVHYGIEGDYKKLNLKADRLVFAQLDLLLLENQLPYKVLKILIKSVKEPEMWEKSLSKFIDDNLITTIPSWQKSRKSKDDLEKEANKDYTHLLERLRDELLTGIKEEKSRNSMMGDMLLWCGDNREKTKTLRSTKELKESGIQVKPSKNNISFYCNLKGTIKMPRFMVDDSTAAKFMNLVALEMCLDFDNEFEVISYLSFLDSLIDTAEDVKELRVTGMLHNYLGSDQAVADLFNIMSRDLVPNHYIYNDVKQNINKYYNNPFTSFVAKGCYTHFSRPWSILVFLGALMGLLFSAIQAYYSLFRHDTKGT